MARDDDTPLSREDLHEATFQFLELAAAVDRYLAKNNESWPKVEGTQKSADRAMTVKLADAVRVMLDARAGLQRAALEAGAMAFEASVFELWNTADRVVASDVRRLWEGLGLPPLADGTVTEILRAFETPNVTADLKVQTRRDAVRAALAKSLGRSVKSMSRLALASPNEQGDRSQEPGRRPTLLGQEVEPFYRHSCGAFELVLENVFAWPTTSVSREELMRRYRDWLEPWQRVGAVRRQRRVMAEIGDEAQAEQAAADYVRRFLPPASPVPESTAKGETYRWHEATTPLDVFSPDFLREPRTPEVLGRFLPPKLNPLWRKRHALDRARGMKKDGLFPADAAHEAAVATVTEWLAGAPHVLCLVDGAASATILDLKAEPSDVRSLVRWRRHREYHFAVYLDASVSPDGSLTLLCPAVSDVVPTHVGSAAPSPPQPRTLRFVPVSKDEAEVALDEQVASWPRKFEVWRDASAKIVVLTTDNAAEARDRGSLPADSKLLLEVTAETPEEARAIAHLRLGLEPFRPAGGPTRCVSCGATVYAGESGECWWCHGR